MDDDHRQATLKAPPNTMNAPFIHQPNWQASLKLSFTHDQGRSFLAKRLHVGPLVIQKTLHPEGNDVCHGVIVHPPGGVAGGDALRIEACLEPNANVLLTTPGAGKWYKSNGKLASQHLHFDVKHGGHLEWFPQENILFEGANVKFSAEINLSSIATYAGWEIVCFGRQAQKECWETGFMHQNLAVRRNGQLIWQECAHLSPQHLLMKSIMGLAGNVVNASFVVVSGLVPSNIIEACRAIKPKATLDLEARYAVSALPEVFVARYVGQSSQCAKQYFEALWMVLRPWYLGRTAVRPRIWST